LADYCRQSDYIKEHIKESTPKINKENSPKKYTRMYYLPVVNDKIAVCKTWFLSVLQVSDKRVRVVTNKLRGNQLRKITDQRGTHVPKNKLSEHIYNEIVQHIESFPKMESHYARKDSKKLYLDSDLNISIIYRLYKEKVQKPVSKSSFRNIFSSFNYSFHTPKKDSCNDCFSFKN